MRIIDYVRELAPVTERRELLNQIRSLREEYDATLAPIIDDVGEVFGTMQLKSDLGMRLSTELRRAISFNTEPIKLVLDTLSNIRGSFDMIESEIRRLFAIQFTNSNLTFDRANMLRFVDGLSFYIRYGRKLLLNLIAQEAMKLGKATELKSSRAEKEWLYTNMAQFITLYPAMSLKTNELKQRLSRASNAEVNEGTYEVAVSALSMAQRDPLNMDGFSPRQNPFVLFGKFLAEYQVERFKEAEQEFLALQLRLQEMREMQSSGKVDARLQKLIKEYEIRISDYNYRLGKIQDRASEFFANHRDLLALGH